MSGSAAPADITQLLLRWRCCRPNVSGHRRRASRMRAPASVAEPTGTNWPNGCAAVSISSPRQRYPTVERLAFELRAALRGG